MTDPAPGARRMHQTTLRFAPDLWDALAAEARLVGVSVAQYVREAALARLAYTAGVRGDAEYEDALRTIGGHPERSWDGQLGGSRRAVRRQDGQIEGAPALWSQSWRPSPPPPETEPRGAQAPDADPAG
jgi:hypothetical protein